MRSWPGLGVLAAILVACTPAPTVPSTGGAAAPVPAGPARSENQVLRIAVGGMQATPSPESSASNIPLFSPMYDPVVTFGANFEVKPAAVEKWALQSDGTTWRLTVRNGLVFSNGDALTADDVAFSYNLIIKTNMPQRGLIGSVTEAKVIDSSTVDVLTSKKDVSTLNGSAYVFVLPKKYYESVGKDVFANKPIGSGPYTLDTFRSSDTIIYKKRTEKHPYREVIATELNFKALPETSAALAGLNTGDIDISSNTFSGDQITQFKSNGFGVVQNLSANQLLTMGKPENDQRKTPLTNIKVREALNYAINKDAIAKGIFQGLAEPVGQAGIPASKFFDPSVKPYPYDVAKAKALLAEAGYPNGFKLTGGIDFTPAQARPDFLLAVQSDLKAVGVDVELNSVELGVFVDKAYARNGQVRGDMFMASVGDSNGMVSQMAFGFFCQPTPAASWYCPPEFERLMKAAYEESDPAKQGDLMRQANTAFRAETPAIFLLATSLFVVHSSKISGINIVTPQFYTYDSAFRTN